MIPRTRTIPLAVLALMLGTCAAAPAQSPGVAHPATDGLGRALPTYEDVGDIRPDKAVAMFFFIWHAEISDVARNLDLTEIITTPDMVNDYDHPNWDPYVNDFWFFWAEPLFGYHNGKDPWVARKQLEMLGAAGIDALFYDCSNGTLLWPEGYTTMAEAMAQARADGVDVPQFAFLLNFGPIPETAYSLADLYENLYSRGLYEESWFRWRGKPVIMAYPDVVGTPGQTAGMSFTATAAFTGVNAACPNWANPTSDLTLSLYPWTGSYLDSVTQAPLAREAFDDYLDNSRLELEFAELPAGEYVWELSAASVTGGVWKFEQETAGVDSYFDRASTAGDYDSQIRIGGSWSALTSGSSRVPVPIAPVQTNPFPGDTAGLKFTAAQPFTGVDALCPNYANPESDVTLSLYSWTGDYAGSVAQTPLAGRRFEDYADNGRLQLEFAELPAGDYVWELSDGFGNAAVWKAVDETPGIDSYFNGSPTTGDYDSRIKAGGVWSVLADGIEMEPVPLQKGLDDATLAAILDFFTFRPGQPDYAAGPYRPDQWGWAENHPQHGYFETSPGRYEEMPVAVAQNWSEQTNSVSTMNGPLIHGRSYTEARGFDDLTTGSSYVFGYNVQEQWDRALAVDPEMVFITGWNEWIVGRYETLLGVENAFTDTFSPEYSRDIEPARGFTKDHYYYQMIANIRRFKGMAAPETATPGRPILIDGAFGDWADVAPDFTDSRGDVLLRDGYGYIDKDSPADEPLRYTNDTARNDIVGARVSHDSQNVFFHVETAAALTSHADPNWMLLLIDGDRDKATGWEGYEWRVDGYAADHTATLSSSTGSWDWTAVGQVAWRAAGAELELALPRTLLNMPWPQPRLDFEFKWLDTPNPTGDIMDVYTDGEAAPDGRFNYHYREYRVNEADARWLKLLNTPH